jgi:hypothetical protein
MSRRKTPKEQRAAKREKLKMLRARDPDANHRKRQSTNNQPRFTPERAKAFCATLADTANVTKSALTIGTSRITVYKWREQNEAFAKAWDAALKIGMASLEDEAVRRAGPEGIDEPVYYKGEKVDTIKRYSDSLLTFLLAAHDEKYRKQRIEHTGKDGADLPPTRVEVVFVKADNGRQAK